MRYALIKHGIVDNVIVADAAYATGLTGYDHIEALDIGDEREVGPGWLYDTGSGRFTAPVSTPAPPSRVLTHKQFRDILTINEQLLLDNFTIAEFAAVEPKIQGLTLVQRAFVRTAIATYREAQEVDLDDEATVQLVSFFGAYDLWDGPDRAEKILGGKAP